jgi:predicted transcriptional regulator of viral defense system
MPVPLFPQLLERALDRHGLLTPDDALAVGASEGALRLLASRGTLLRKGFAIYQIPQLAGDRLAQYQEALLWVREAGALSHDTALDLHQLSDINPANVHVTIDPKTRFRRRLPDWLELHRGRLDEADTTWLEGLRITTPARTVLDCVATHVGEQFIDLAIATGRTRGLLSGAALDRIEIARTRQRLAALESAL